MILSTPHPIEIFYGGGIALACGRDSEIHPDQLHGLFADDTRVISTYRFRVAGYQWQELARLRDTPTTAQWEMENKALRVPSGLLAEGMLHYRLRREVDGALLDLFTVETYTLSPVAVRLALLIDADFADIFEVKGRNAHPRFAIQRVPRPNGMSISYVHADFQRGLEVTVAPSHGTSDFVGAQIVFDVVLRPREPWTCTVNSVPVVHWRQMSIRHGNEPQPKSDLASTFRVEAAGPLGPAVSRASEDLAGLDYHLFENEPFYAAGAPWFLTLFGRDSLLTSLMSALCGTKAAVGSLVSLGRLQATKRDDFRDAEPGKILHELRHGELVHFGIEPHSPYYGTWDAPALYVLTLWNTYRWTGDLGFIKRQLPVAEAALAWCDTGGDADHDGFLEYFTRSSKGYRNQSWKDAEDAIPYEDGTLADPPIATVEMQGYLYAAKLAMAELQEAVGRHDWANQLRTEAALLRQHVEDVFWMEDAGCYALALDNHKRLIRTIASNAGHLLWCGLPTAERARRVAERFLQPDMFTGYGIRTLSSLHRRFNPMSYQLGSVWPHDNALFAAGLMRYGLRDHAATILKGILDAAVTFENQRLPELFCGFSREDGAPVPYEKANVPQAWAAASPVLAVQLFLGLVPDVPHGRYYLSPWLPDWVPELDAKGIKIGDGELDIVLQQNKGITTLERAGHSSLVLAEETTSAPLWGKPY